MSSNFSEWPLRISGDSLLSMPSTLDGSDRLLRPSAPISKRPQFTEIDCPSPVATLPYRLPRGNSLPTLTNFVVEDLSDEPTFPSPPAKASFPPRGSSPPPLPQCSPTRRVARAPSMPDLRNVSTFPTPSTTPTKAYARSLASSKTPSIAPSQRGQRYSDTTWLNDVDKYSLMIKHIHERCGKNHWLPTDATYAGSVVALRASEGTNTINGYKSFPAAGPHDLFLTAATALNVEVAVCIFSHVVQVIIGSLPANAWDFPLRDDTRVQIIQRIQDLPRARKYQYAAFVREQKCLVVWSDSASKVVEQGEELEKKIFDFIWNDGDGVGRYELKKPKPDALDELENGDLGLRSIYKRKRGLLLPILVAAAWVVIGFFLGSGIKTLMSENAIVGGYVRFALIATCPTLFFAMFMCLVIASYVAYIFGPSSQVFSKSLFYSGAPPEHRLTGLLPHITIQMPVYKESLSGVIDPTIRSLKAAISTYELQGGTASIFVNDDGMQLLDEDMANGRMKYYHDQGIGWVARPPHKKDGYLRAGRFKKASNMNFGLNLSYRLEIKLRAISRHEKWTAIDEQHAYDMCLQQCLDEDPRAWAAGNIRVGELILIVDSDTRVPSDCFLDAATEFDESPDLGILQHKSGVMQVVGNYWENGIAYFTNLIYACITYAIAAGDVGPFVGHNAFLRWSALQEMMWTESNGERKWWSESHVSEDFEMSLKLQNAGWRVRYATYCGDGFKEGVSLTVYDELARWEKYAYGCAELVFHPFKDWLRKGPFTPLFRKFLTSQIPGASKFTIMGYIGTYYAIGSAWIMLIINYFVTGWCSDSIDQFYLSSFAVFVTVIAVFTVAGPIMNAVLKYRCKMNSFVDALAENYMWVPMFIVFFGGLSMHVSYALLCYLFSVDLQWGATAKELDASNFWLELPKIVKGFKWMYLFVFAMSTAMIMIAYVVPQDWRITGFYSTVPLGVMLASHALFPITVPQPIFALIITVESPIDDIYVLIRKAYSGVVLV